MGTSTLYASKYAYLPYQGGNAHSNALQPIGDQSAKFLLRFPALSSSLQYKQIKSVHLVFQAKGHYGAWIREHSFAADDFSAASVTWGTAPTPTQDLIYNSAYNKISIGSGVQSGYDVSVDVLHPPAENPDDPNPNRTPAVEILRNRTCILQKFLFPQADDLELYTPSYSGSDAGNKRPCLLVNYEDDTGGAVDLQGQSPSSINPRVDNTFSWFYTLTPDTLTPIAVTDESFVWFAEGETTGHPVSVTPGAMEVTIPAGTFPVGSNIRWTISVTCNSGVTTTSETYTVSTSAPTVTANPITPVSSVESTDGPVVFRWDVSGTAGLGFTKSVLAYRERGASSWTTLATVNAPTLSYTAPANTFPIGDIEWSVTAYNIDNTAGPAAYASFVSLRAPDAPSVLVTARPFATIKWQASGQQAYQIELDGEDLGVFFGSSTTTYKLATPLNDGNHTARVRIQSAYGLWSQFGSAEFVIQNSPGRAVTLSAEFGVDAVLTWETTAVYSNFMIFRDGVQIGFTHDLTFTDRHALGKHDYYIINRFDSGNYTKSNTVSGCLCVRWPMVAALSGGEWISLRQSERSEAEQRFSWRKTHSLRHVCGARYPVLESSPFEDLSGTYDAAFLKAADAAPFRALRGKVIIIKSREGKVVVGALTDISEIVNSFYLSFQFAVDQIEWEDFVDDTND